MKKRRLILLALALIAASVITILLWPGEREPEYQGKKLSEWLLGYRSARAQSEQAEAANAVRQIGTNAIPWLVEWISCDDELPAWRLRLFHWASEHRRIAKGKMFRSLVHIPEMDKILAGCHGFEILGPAAKDAVPELSHIMHGPMLYGKARRAVLALSKIGNHALPVLLSALSNESQTNRYWIAWCIGNMRDLGTNVDSTVPALVQCIKGKDKELGGAAAEALGKLHPTPDLAIPALKLASHDSDNYLRHPALMALGQFGAQARSAIPDLLEAANDPDAGIRYAATYALNKIAPELLPPEDRHGELE
jgi:hypothetical protein